MRPVSGHAAGRATVQPVSRSGSCFSIAHTPAHSLKMGGASCAEEQQGRTITGRRVANHAT